MLVTTKFHRNYTRVHQTQPRLAAGHLSAGTETRAQLDRAQSHASLGNSNIKHDQSKGVNKLLRYFFTIFEVCR